MARCERYNIYRDEKIIYNANDEIVETLPREFVEHFIWCNFKVQQTLGGRLNELNYLSDNVYNYSSGFVDMIDDPDA